MRRDPRAYLWDVREAADSILDFVAGLDLATYISTPLVHAAQWRHEDPGDFGAGHAPEGEAHR